MCTIKPLENSGKLLKIEPKDRSVVLTFDKYPNLELLKEVFLGLGDYYYPNKEVTLEQYYSLEKFSQENSNLSYLLFLLSQKYYSYTELVNKLILKKKISKEKSEELVNKLISLNLYSIDTYAQYFFTSSLEKGYSLDFITKELIANKVSNKKINELVKENEFSFDFNDFILKLIKKNPSYSINKQKNYIYTKLYKLGYSSSEINNIIDSFFKNNPDCMLNLDKQENENLINEIKRISKSLTNKNLGPYETKQKIIARLLSKGFSYDKIKMVLESMNEDGK